MRSYISKIGLFFILTLFSVSVKSQVLFDMGKNRNLAYISSGFKDGYANATIGIARRDSIKFLKRELIGLLDVSLPLIQRAFVTKHSIRKGFQIDLYKKVEFRIPFMFASSSIIREDRYFKLHDVTAEFSLVPGFYRKKYTIALDLRYELIVFRLVKYTPEYYVDDHNHNFDPNSKRHWEKPLFSIAKVGFVAGLNLKHCVFYLKSGYERNPFIDFNFKSFLPGYAVLGFGYKFGTRPFK